MDEKQQYFRGMKSSSWILATLTVCLQTFVKLIFYVSHSRIETLLCLSEAYFYFELQDVLLWWSKFKL